MTYTKPSRVQAVLRGEHPDFPPFSCWHHFGPGAFYGEPAVDAHLRHLEKLDVDFLKVMNDNEYPREQPGMVIQTVEDLRTIRVHGLDAEEFTRQLDLLRRLRQRIGDELLMTTTMFNAWSTLRRLCAPPSTEHGPPKLNGGTDSRDERITGFLAQDRAAVAAALQRIGQSLAGFARACLQAGADGVFLSVRDDWVDSGGNGPGTYNEMVREADLEILQAASKGTLNILHVCGRPRDFERFAAYPAHAINWADRCAPPSIAQAREKTKLAICGGLDNLGTLATGTPENCSAEARDAVAQAQGRPILLAPGCTYDPQKVPLANLSAARDALRGG